jgi:hypothetical protein
MFQVRCSKRWLVVSAGAGGLAALSIRMGGLPMLAAWGTAGMVGLTYATLVEPRLPVLKRVTLHIANLPPELDGLRIGQLSDMHLGYIHCYENTQWAVQQVMNEQPELIVVTGDFVSFHSAISQIPDLFRPLQAPLGVYAITGNHDHWEGVDEVREQAESVGIEFLINANTRLQWRGGSLWLAGIDDLWYGIPDLHATLHGIPAGAFTILLAHEPDFADVAAQRQVHVQLSGHTHGGHIDLPWLGSPCLPHHGIHYVSGQYQVGSMHLYVSRGLGGFPLRFHCPPDATILTLKRREI